MLGGGDDDGTVTLDAQSGCAPFSMPSRPATTALLQAESALAGHHEEKVSVRRGARDEPSRRLFWAWQVTDGQPITWDDVAIDGTTSAYKLRREMEAG